jgi:hypothetical protein
MLRQTTRGRKGVKREQGKAVQENQSVADMVTDVLARQAGARAKRTGESFDETLRAVLETEAGRQLKELRDGPHGDERAQEWQENLTQERTKERSRAPQEERRKQAHRAAAWERFMQTELRKLELRKDGQLARLLGEPLPGEPPEALERLALEDQRQAQEGLVALMRDSEVSYKRVEELIPEDRPARDAANRARRRWLDQRMDRRVGNDG